MPNDEQTFTAEQVRQRIAIVYKQGFHDGRAWAQERMNESLKVTT